MAYRSPVASSRHLSVTLLYIHRKMKYDVDTHTPTFTPPPFSRDIPLIMLHLKTATDPGWFARIADDLDIILLDHTHLEKRAGSTAMSMIFRYADKPALARGLAEVVQEEMEHFVRMVDVLEERGVAMRRLHPSTYASSLAAHARKHDPDALLDKLLVASLIEARSCERFQILAQQLPDPKLATLYDDLYRDEARHHTLYAGLAREIFGDEVTHDRLDVLATAEVQALKEATGEPRLHSF